MLSTRDGPASKISWPIGPKRAPQVELADAITRVWSCWARQAMEHNFYRDNSADCLGCPLRRSIYYLW